MISLFLALILDALAGEPPAKLHPVVWMGNYLSWMKKRNKSKNWRAFWQGVALLGLGLFMFVSVACFVSFFFIYLPEWLSMVWLALLLKPMFSIRSLLDAGESVKQALMANDLIEARRLLSWHLVSRDTAELSEKEVAGATVSSLAENITDSIVAPLFYFALFYGTGFGLAAAVFYRFINTADAMLGYKNEQLEYFGKSAARLDDALNFIPARLTAVLLFGIFLGSKKDAWQGLIVASKLQTPSPNGTWTMGMVAGGLNIKLEKKDVYVLNRSGQAASHKSIAAVQNLILSVTAVFVLFALGWQYVN